MPDVSLCEVVASGLDAERHHGTLLCGAPAARLRLSEMAARSVSWRPMQGYLSLLPGVKRPRDGSGASSLFST